MRPQLPGDISPNIPDGTLLFRAYGDDFFQLNEERIETGLFLHRGKIVSSFQPSGMSDLVQEKLTLIFADPPEVLLIGTGRRTAFPSAALLQQLQAHHIGYECMDSRAAARTYNILVGEGRRVSAVLILPGVRP